MFHEALIVSLFVCMCILDPVNSGSGHFWIEEQIAKGLTSLKHQISGETVYLYATLEAEHPETEDPIELKYDQDWTYELSDTGRHFSYGRNNEFGEKVNEGFVLGIQRES
ncbi:hypothetical protein DdX_10758 [Ditylenchus destructor]|uniref:Uncharacterized protein n=1 Tax=Ditylenchus destructor TaxID=166010 RepID=A0AAD4N063_9BILA|nr:hypothetical protein DdX_10758 [Ditylenchus destructor]